MDLTPQAHLELLQCISGRLPNDCSDSTVRFRRLVNDILFESGATVSGLIDSYVDTLHKWFHLIDVKQLREDTQSAPEKYKRPAVLVLLLVIMLITTQTCGHVHHLRHRKLYKALKVVVTTLQSQTEPDLCLIQAQTLISLYECGHGMTHQAHLTLSSAITLATLVATNTSSIDSPLHWQTALMMLDRRVICIP